MEENKPVEYEWSFWRNVTIIGEVIHLRLIFFILTCSALAYFPYRVFDKLGVIYIAGIELAVLCVGLRYLESYRKHILLFFLSVFIFFFAGEIYFRLSCFGIKGLSFPEYNPADYGNPFTNFEYSDETYTGIKPNTNVRFKSNMVSINDRGFRDRTHAIEKPEGVYRIVVVGASICFGSGVEEDERFSSIVERKMNASDLSGLPGKPKSVEVINLSIPGVDFGNMIHVLKNEGLRYNPDLIMFLVHRTGGKPGEIQVKAKKVKAYTESTYGLYTDCKYALFRNTFFFARLLVEARRGALSQDRGDKSSKPSFLPSLNKKESGKDGNKALQPVDIDKKTEELPQLVAAFDMLKGMGKGSKVALYLLKPRERLNDPYHNLEFRNFVKYLAGKHGMAVIDTYEADFSGYSAYELQALPGEGHGNKHAHRIIGDYMYGRLMEILPYKKL